jgi:hypothetical protein
MDHDIDASAVSIASFDAYFLISAFAIENTTDKPVHIVTFAAGEASSNFVISSVETETKDNYTSRFRDRLTTVEVKSSVIDIEARRTRLARAFTLCLLHVNWTLTIGSIYIASLVFKTEEINNTVLLFPITIVLAIPTLRTL